MFLTIYKLESRLEKLAELRYDQMQNILPMVAYDDIRDKNTVVQLPAVAGERFSIDKNDFLVGRDRYIWAEKTVTVPISRKGFDTITFFDLGKTSGGFSDGFESLIYVNGVPYQGVDSYHNEVFFAPEMAEKSVELKLLIWSGLEGGGEHKDQVMRVSQADVGYIHKNTDEFYFLAKTICKTWHLLSDNEPAKQKILDALNKAMLMLDLFAPKEVFYAQIDEAYEVLLNDLEKIGKTHDVTVYCVGHSHIDVAWLWRIKHTKEKCLRSFSTVLRLMERYEEYNFIQSQPQLYKFVKENYPDVYERIRERVQKGQYEPNGGMWVEADCNLISGESMVRQFLYGSKFFKEEFGRRSNCLWLPDVFGYSWAMPQVLKQCGIDTFMTTKISWNEYNKIPHDTFTWRGMDGSEVLTHFVTTPNDDNPDYYTYFTYNGLMEPSYVYGTWDNYKDKALNKDVLMAFGYGDGGGGPTRDMIMSRRAMDKVPGLPNVKTISAGKYFDKLHENLKNSDGYLHTWVGELYFENHRGTYTSQAYNKRMNRKIEYDITNAEALGVISKHLGGNYNGDTLQKVWEIILLNQFHDIIPGSSITEVYEDCHKYYAECEVLLESVRAENINNLMKANPNAYTFWNFTPFVRNALVEVPEKRQGIFRTKNGSVLKSEKTEDGYLVRTELCPTSLNTIFFEEGENVQKSSPFTIDVKEKRIETPFYTVQFDEHGLMTYLFDKENKRSVLKEFGNRLTAYEDIPIMFDAWNVDYDQFVKYDVIDDLTSFKVIYQGALELKVQMEYRYGNSTISQIVHFYADERRIDFKTTADWHEVHKFVKACFDVDVFATKAVYDIQFGNIERGNHHSTSWDFAKFEVCAHKWVDMSEYGYGVALLNDCKYGHSVKDTLMAISLIKCATWPDTKADQGEHKFTYSLLPHAGGFREAGVHIEAEFLNQKLTAMRGASDLDGRSLIKISENNISIDAMKLSEDGKSLIIRIHEYMGKRTNFVVESDFGILSVTPVNMLEEAVGEIIKTERIIDVIKPHEIKNYSVILKK